MWLQANWFSETREWNLAQTSANHHFLCFITSFLPTRKPIKWRGINQLGVNTQNENYCVAQKFELREFFCKTSRHNAMIYSFKSQWKKKFKDLRQWRSIDLKYNDHTKFFSEMIYPHIPIAAQVNAFFSQLDVQMLG